MLITPHNLRLIISATQLILGVLLVISGLRKLLAREFVPAAKALALQSARIGQKGLKQDISLIAQSAAQLCDSVNRLVRTSSGVGAFLILVGVFFLASSYYIVRHS